MGFHVGLHELRAIVLQTHYLSLSQPGAMQQKIPQMPVLARGTVDPPQQTTPPQVHKPPPTQLTLSGQQHPSRAGQHG